PIPFPARADFVGSLASRLQESKGLEALTGPPAQPVGVGLRKNGIDELFGLPPFGVARGRERRLQLPRRNRRAGGNNHRERGHSGRQSGHSGMAPAPTPSGAHRSQRPRDYRTAIEKSSHIVGQ